MPDTPTTPNTVFVSHAQADNEFADALVAALRKAGADVWYDRQSLGPGVMLRPTIQRELYDRRIFIVVLSKAACASQWVKEECDWAYDLWRDDPKTRVLLPVLAGPLDRADFRELLSLKGMHRIEGDDLHPLPQAEAIAEVLRLLGLAPATTPDASPSTSAPELAESMDDHITRGEEQGEQVRDEEALAALRTYEQVLALHPRDTLTWRRKGDALYYLKRFEEAVGAYEQAAPEDPLAWAKKGRALYCLNRYEEALAACERALERYPKNTTAWRWKEKALRSLGRDAEADAAEQRVRELGLKDG